MNIQHSVQLKPYNTFGIEAFADSFAVFSNIEELKELIQFSVGKNLFILGGGSNILFTKNISELTIKNEIKGIDVIGHEESSVLLKVGAGEKWHDFVMYCVENQLYGVENLSLIPGSVGASPMQNIGAYGVEVKDVIEKVEAYHIASGEIHYFSNEACAFDYRESIFKKELKGQYVITHVIYRLSENKKLNTAYGAIEAEILAKGITKPTIKDISQAVISIRQSKLPNPKEIGNAGSFFKNPVVDKKLFLSLKSSFPQLPNYPAANGSVKIPAGWLIEQASWKGKRFGNYGVHKNQALVLVNYGGASGQEIVDLSSQIIEDIYNKFGILLEREVNIY